MKTILTFWVAVFLAATSLLGQHNQLKVTGNLSGMKDSAYLYFFQTAGGVGSLTDTILVEKGIFSFETKLKESPAFVILMGEGFEPSLRFWGENDSMHIEGDYSDFDNSRIYHSEINDVFTILKEAMEDHNRLFSLIKQYAHTYPGLSLLKGFKDQFPLEELQEIYKNLPEEFKAHPDGQTIKTYLSARNVKVPEIGDQLVDFEAFDPEGEMYKVSELNDRYLLVEFGSAFCGPCFAAAPELSKLQAENSEKLKIVSFSLDITEENWRMGLENIRKKDKDGHILHLWDGKGETGPIPLWYGVKGIPVFYLFDPEGKVLDKWVGYNTGWVEERWAKVGQKE